MWDSNVNWFLKIGISTMVSKLSKEDVHFLQAFVIRSLIKTSQSAFIIVPEKESNFALYQLLKSLLNIPSSFQSALIPFAIYCFEAGLLESCIDSSSTCQSALFDLEHVVHPKVPALSNHARLNEILQLESPSLKRKLSEEATHCYVQTDEQMKVDFGIQTFQQRMRSTMAQTENAQSLETSVHVELTNTSNIKQESNGLEHIQKVQTPRVENTSLLEKSVKFTPRLNIDSNGLNQKISDSETDIQAFKKVKLDPSNHTIIQKDGNSSDTEFQEFNFGADPDE